MTSNMKKYDGLDVVEALSVLGSIGGSIASVVFQEVVFASIPLSLSVALNLANRRRLLDAINQSNQTAIAHLTQQNVATQTELGTLTEQLTEVRQLTTDMGQSISNLSIAHLTQQNVETQAKLGTLTEQLIEVRQLTTNLGQSISNLEKYTQVTHAENTKIVEIVGCLQEISTCSQTISINSNDANAYYNRGLNYEQLEDKESAIRDYTEAIRINPNYAEAYYKRAIARADLGNKKGAVEDLREAAKLFFDKGDIANYQKARDLSKKFHELSSQFRIDAFEELAVERLFS